MWRYIDLEGHIQGPFPASQMIDWYSNGHLDKLDLRMCGTVSHFPSADMTIILSPQQLLGLHFVEEHGSTFEAQY